MTYELPPLATDGGAIAGYRDPVVPISVGHLGWSWTIEGGIVEVVTTGRSIIRAPLSHPINVDGSRGGREWWPDQERFRDMWYPLTFATIAEAERNMKEAYR